MGRKSGVFIQYGVYHSKNKREKTKFKVLHGLELTELEKEIKPCLLRLQKKSLDREYEV